MNNLELAEQYIRQAQVRIKYSSKALEDGEYPYVIRQAQESVELALKGVLRLIGAEPPKWHDVGPILKDLKEKFPEWFRSMIHDFASISRELRREREPAMYGDEETATPPYKLYSRSDAERAVRNAKRVVEGCRKLLEEWKKAGTDES